MVQSVSQYEFIYEYILDYLSSKGLIVTKFPRNVFGVEMDEEDSDVPILNKSNNDNIDKSDIDKIECLNNTERVYNSSVVKKEIFCPESD